MLFEDEGMCFFWLKQLPEALKSFNSLKVPTRDNLFYKAATLAKNKNRKEAREVLREATLVSKISIENFIKMQKYKNIAQANELLSILKTIS